MFSTLSLNSISPRKFRYSSGNIIVKNVAQEFWFKIQMFQIF